MGKARPRKGRPVCGVVFLDKPKGMSSNHALQRVKRLYKAQKAGHTGALDPLATGLLLNFLNTFWMRIKATGLKRHLVCVQQRVTLKVRKSNEKR